MLQRSIVRLARSLEPDDEVVAALVERIGCKDRRLSSQRDDFAPKPFEVLAALISVRQNVDGVSGWHRADLLKTTPRLHTRVRRPGGKLMCQEEPARDVQGN
jgi:hypothetical protein